MSRSLPAFVLGILVFSLDQLTKWVVLQYFEPGHSLEVIPGFFRLTLIFNKGAAWGILQDQAFWLTLLAFGALIFLAVARRHFTSMGLLSHIALGLLLGGIAGNLADRLQYGKVVDFLDFYCIRWPAFNVADSAICIGVALYLLDSFKRPQAAELKVES